METIKQQRNYGLSCLIRPNQETGVFIGHCLDYDLMECGDSPKEAWENLKIVIKRHIEYCYANFREGLTRQAKKEAWDNFYCTLRESKLPPVVETIEIQSADPLPENDIHVWIQGAGINVNTDKATYVC